jgi:hypothetical protein
VHSLSHERSVPNRQARTQEAHDVTSDSNHLTNARNEDRLGNTAMANGLVIKARMHYRRADAIRREAKSREPRRDQ